MIANGGSTWRGLLSTGYTYTTVEANVELALACRSYVFVQITVASLVFGTNLSTASHAKAASLVPLSGTPIAVVPTTRILT